jgi:redox-sensitive bicupin YhaK (pirin superfamily)
MIVRPRGSLFHADSGWFSAGWHFSFGSYRDPDNTCFGDLWIFNDDWLAPGTTWPTRPDRDIEVVTYVAEGLLENAGSPGYGGILSPGSVQRVTLRPGVEHSQGNHSATEPVRFIQMWIIPARRGLEPSMEQRKFSVAARRGRLLPILVPAPGYGAPGVPENPDAVTVHQDAAVYTALLEPGRAVNHQFREGFSGYLFLVHGDAHTATDQDAAEIDTGGAAKVIGEREMTIRARQAGAEILLVETRVAVACQGR